MPAGVRATGPEARAASEDMVMQRRRLRAILLASTLLAAAGGGAGPAAADSLADALVTAYQTSPLLAANQAALRSLDEGVPQARADRRPQVDASVSASSQTTSEDFQEDQLNQLQAFINATLLLFDNGQTSAAVELARNQVAAGRADLKGRGAARAVQRGAGLRRHPPRRGVRAAGGQ